MSASLIQTESNSFVIIPDFGGYVRLNGLKSFINQHGKILFNKCISVDAIPALVSKYNLEAKDGIYIQKQYKVTGGGCCPECGSPLMMVEGCASCSAGCGYSKCS